MALSTYDFVPFDEKSIAYQNKYKDQVIKLTEEIDVLNSPNAKIEAMKKLEECFMWICKSIRDDQIARTGKPKKGASE